LILIFFSNSPSLSISLFKELLEIRHSVVVLGGAGSGKSTIWRTLAACHNHAALQLKKKNKMKSNASQSSGGGGATINSEDNNGSSNSLDELNMMKPVTVYEAVNPKAVTNDEVNYT
jgi:ABC-type phosphate/phosphonate transport system ATPase subunit